MITVTKSRVTFEASDFPFIRKFGIMKASQMVVDHKAVSDTPFIFDAYQLSDFIGCSDVRRMFRLVRDPDSYYKNTVIKKKNGGVRHISAPDSYLLYAQRRILRRILYRLPVSQYATAYKKNSSLAANALPHTGKKYLLKLDITDFFGSIRFSQVYSAAFNTRHFPKQIGWLLTSLCCYHGVLPQGAPTSPTLSNLVMKNFDDNIGGWCARHGISYTRYCDDMTFSSDEPLYHVYCKVRSMLGEMGFELNESKTKFLTSSTRQVVTGLTVNEKVRVPRDYKRKLRQQVHYVLEHGFDKTACECISGKGARRVDCYYKLIGKVEYVIQIEPDNAFFVEAFDRLRRMSKYFDEYDYYRWLRDCRSHGGDDDGLPF